MYTSATCMGHIPSSDKGSNQLILWVGVGFRKIYVGAYFVMAQIYLGFRLHEK